MIGFLCVGLLLKFIKNRLINTLIEMKEVTNEEFKQEDKIKRVKYT